MHVKTYTVVFNMTPKAGGTTITQQDTSSGVNIFEALAKAYGDITWYQRDYYYDITSISEDAEEP